MKSLRVSKRRSAGAGIPAEASEASKKLYHRSGRSGAGNVWNALYRELHVVSRELRPIMKFDPFSELELPGGVIDRPPAFGEPRLWREVVSRPNQCVEHMLHRFGVRAAI